MRCIQRLVRNGRSTQVTLPKAMLMQLRWLPTDTVIIDMLEDGSILLTKFEPPKRITVPRRGVTLSEPETVQS